MPSWVMISVQWVCNDFAERRLDESLQTFVGRLGAFAMHISMHGDWFAHANANSKSRGSEACCGSQLPWLEGEGEDQGNDDEELGQKQQQGKRKQQPQHWVHGTPAAAPNNTVSSF